MSKLGKSFKNKLLRQALALVLSGTMVMSGVPVSAAETSANAAAEAEDATDTMGGYSEEAEEALGKEESAEAQEQEQKAETETSEEESEEAQTKESSASKAEDEETKASETEETETETSETEETETEASETEENKTSDTSTYASTEGNSETLVKYNLEGFADSYNVTGGGLLTTTNSNYYKCTTEKEFLDALVQVRTKTTPSVIEITTDMELGNLELDAQDDITFSDYSKVILADGNTPLLHPTLIETGVSDLYLQDLSNLTIFSQNGSAIKHCGIIVKRVENLIIRNITFDELWEWDENTSGAYDRNDWDYIGIQDSDGIWIDHCTFYKSYDGVVDIKFSSTDASSDDISNVTISWCRFLPGSEDNTFFDAQMTWLEEHKDDTDASLTYYNELRDTDELTADQVRQYAYGQKKTHLLGQSDSAKSAAGIKLTLANNYYFDSMDRLPRLRFGTVHEYNCVLDSQELYDWKTSGNTTLSSKITSNGAISTCGGKMLLENCYINGINNPLVSGNASSPTGYINAVDSLYYVNGVPKTLEPKNNNSSSYTGDKTVLVTDADEFIEALPYSDYITYDALSLNDDIVPLTGAGVLTMSEVQWEKTSYGTRNTIEDPESSTTPSSSEEESSSSESSSEDESGSDTVISFSLSADDLEEETLTADLTKNGFTIKATDTKTVVIASSNKTIEGTGFTHCIKLGGTVAVDSRSIHFTADTAGKLTVYAISAGSSDRTLGLYAYDGSTDTQPMTGTAPGSAPAVITFDITEKGDYYIGSTNSGINIYYIAFASNAAEDGDTEETSSAEESTSEETSSTEESSSAEESSSEETSSAEESSSEETSSTEESSSAEESSSEESSSAEESTSEESSSAEESSSGEETSGTEESSEETESSTVIEFSLSADDLDAGNITADLEKNGFTIKATSSAAVTVDASNKTIGGTKFTRRIKLVSTGSASSRSIRFTAETAGKLTVYAISANGDEDRTLGLYAYDGSTSTQLDTATAPGSAAAIISFAITEAGDYYIAGSSGINIYYIAFSNREDEEEELPTEESEVEATTFEAPEGDLVYDAEEAKEQSKVVYNLEGYAASANVTGGGLLREDSTGYYKVTNEKEFIEVLSSLFRVNDKPNVIEITTDLNLGNLELNENFGLNITTSSDGYNNLFRAYTSEPIMHPTLKETGVTYIKLHDFHNLTIFSKNGATIRHAGIKIEGGTSNVIIRNLTFDELWEWDEETIGDYDRNDWDYMDIEDDAEGIWIDHCTFYKSYDGIIDLKNNAEYENLQRVTISWCEFLPGSKNNTFFNEQMTWLEENIDSTTYYKQLRQTENMSAEDVWWYAYGQKKTHLFGAGDSDTQDKAIRVTLANNYYKNSMSRLPRLRYGKVHEYNCVLDSEELNTQYLNGNSHITGNGAISTCNGQMLLENCYIRGVRTPLRSDYSGVEGYLKAVNCIYYMAGQLKELSYSGKVVDEEKFKENLLYSDYITYDASKLFSIVVPYAGAGKLDMTTVQWEATSYGERTGSEGSTTTYPEDTTEPEISGDNPTETPGDDESETESGTEVETESGEQDNIPEYSFDKDTLKVIVNTAYYNKKKQLPSPAVYDLSRDANGNSVEAGTGFYKLTAGLDYEIVATSGNFTDISSDTVQHIYSIKGIESYEGSEVTGLEFIIYDKTTTKSSDDSQTIDISKVKTIVLNKNDKKAVYTGYDIEPIPSGLESMTQGVDYVLVYKNNRNAGKAYVTILGQGKYVGQKTLTFTISKRSMTTVDAADYETSYTYLGAPIKLDGLKLTMDNGAYTLKSNEYTVTYKNNSKAGTATATIKGVNNFSGSKKITYAITAGNLEELLEGYTPEIEYSAKGAKLSYIEVGNLKLKENTDYKVTYPKDIKGKTSGTVSLTITGKNSYKNSPQVTITATIVPSKLYVEDNLTVDQSKASKLETAIKVTDGAGVKLKYGTDYTLTKVSTDDNIVTLQLESKNPEKYATPTETVTCRLATKISKAKAAKGISITKVYDGRNAVRITGSDVAKLYPELAYTDANGITRYYFTIDSTTYKNNLKKGTAQVTINATNNGKYYGTRVVKFKIVE